MVLAVLETMRKMRDMQEWNQYIINWPIALDALRKLWETGKVFQLKSPLYEPLKKAADK